MKKTILTLSIVFLAFAAQSQAKFELGLKAGLNTSNPNFDNPGANVSSASSFHGGMYALIKLTKLGIQPEILYSPQKNDVNFGSGNLSQERVYIDIPIMVKFYLAAGLNLQAGPQFGILTTAEEAGVDVKNTLKGSATSLAIGGGWDAPFGLQANVRYIIGLSDINGLSTSTEAIKNRTLQVSIGYRLFKLGK